MGEQEIDSQLKEMLDLLRPVPRRSSDAMHRSRSRFYADLDVYFPVEASYTGSIKAPALKPATVAARFRPLFYRPAVTYLAVAVILLIALFGGGYATASAAGDALPGDALYPVKLNLEQAHLSLTTNRVRKAELHLEFAQHRMEELNALVALGEYERVAPLANQFNHELSLALGAAQDLDNLNSNEATRLKDQAAQALGLFKATVDLVVKNAPPSLQPGLQDDFERATNVNPPANNTNNGSGNSNSNGNPNAGNPNPGNPNAGNANNNGNPSPANNNASPNSNANVHSNSNGAPGTVITGNNNDNSRVNPNSNKDKQKETGRGRDKEKDKDKDKEPKENNGKND
jgi:hypothetical protein